MKKHFLGLSLLICSFVAISCKKEVELPKPISPQTTTSSTPVLSYEIVNSWHHDPGAFTQGLQFFNGQLYETTGLNSRSSLRRVDLGSGKVLQKIDLDNEYFGEGMTIFGGKIYVITYQTHVGFIYDLKTFKQLGSWKYEGEGWGLTNDGTYIIMSNGTSKINYLDPRTLAIIKTIDVTDQGFQVEYINELEYIEGIIYANIWTTNRIVKIDPTTGKVLSWIDMSGLLSAQEIEAKPDVLNGIAYDEKTKRIFVTGKLWPRLFEVKSK